MCRSVGTTTRARRHHPPSPNHRLESKHHSTRSIRNPSSRPGLGWTYSPAGWRTQTDRKKDPTVLTALEHLLEDATAGDPISGLKWSRKTLEKLRRQLRTKGVIIGRSTIARLLRERDYSLRSNRKAIASTHDSERDRQFRYIDQQRRAFEKAGNPVISVDTKKKELIGRFKNPGRTWRQSALEVNDHDFPSQAEGKAIPYGIYDLTHNSGYVLLGT